MRPVAIPALLLLALAGLAVVPSASAAPEPQPCSGTAGGGKEAGPVTVYASPPCYTVEVPLMSCPLAGSWKEVRAQTVAVRVYTCDSPDPAASFASPCACPPPPRCPAFTTVGPVAEAVTVTGTDDCRVLVSFPLLTQLVACGDPLDGATAVVVGPLTVFLPCGQVDYCEPPFECYPAAAPEAPVPPVCVERTVPSEDSPVRAGFSSCSDEFVVVDLCPGQWGSPQRIEAHRDLGPAYVHAEWCAPHAPPPGLAAAASELPDPCGPTALCQGPECTPRTVASEVDHHNSVTVNGDCTVDVVTGYGQTCVGAWTGHDTHHAGPVTWDRYYCRFPGGDPGLGGLLGASSAAVDPFPTCVRECAPGADWCEAQQATPGALGPPAPPLDPRASVWGGDCDVDVEPIGACAPPSGKMVEKRAGPVHLRLLLCGGDLPDWS